MAEMPCWLRLRVLKSQLLLVKRVHALVLLWHGHAGEIGAVAHRLEVAAAQQEVHLDTILLFQEPDSFVDLVQFSVAASFHGDLHHAGGRGRRLESVGSLSVQQESEII